MSRSRRKTPILPVTSAASDRPFKGREHRRERRASRVALSLGDDPRASGHFGNPCSGDKDGKLYKPVHRSNWPRT